MSQLQIPKVGRNDSCPCGSGKKYKRCHGLESEPQPALKAPEQPSEKAAFDPGQLDPQWMANFALAMKKLPRGQVQKIQALMSKAMMGKDISREAAELERTLPPEFQSLLGAKTVQDAAEQQMEKMDATRKQAEQASEEQKAKKGKFWSGLFGKKK
jgi:uncharacterized protein YecA (UPF0149 family)